MAMKILKVCFVCSVLFAGKTVMGQDKLVIVDTLRFISIGSISDTLYQTRQKIKSNIYKVITFYGLNDNRNLNSTIDTFIVGKEVWKKLYNNDTLPFLSIKSFTAKKKVNEYLSSESKDAFYYEYEPIKKFSVKKREFYLYRVKPMSGKGMVEGLGDDIRYVIFDFSIGEIYRSSYRIKKVLSGYEEYVPYFKW